MKYKIDKLKRWSNRKTKDKGTKSQGRNSSLSTVGAGRRGSLSLYIRMRNPNALPALDFPQVRIS